LICLRYGLVDHMDNEQIDPKEVYDELIRQLSCKTLVHEYLAGRIDTVQSLPIDQEDETK